MKSFNYMKSVLKTIIGIVLITSLFAIHQTVIAEVGESPTLSTPTIEFTYVPPYGSFDNLKGIVTNINPTNYNVVVYIYVSGWWIKPTFAQPLTPIQNDDNWICDITTGGIDQLATKIKAYLIPNGFSPPLMSGGQTLPTELDSFPSVEVIRHRLQGDINEDGQITSADALLYLRYSVSQNISPYHMSISDDVTCDGAIHADDALKLLRKAVGHNVNLNC